jgi:thioredoxin reductase (NADPH)
MIDLDLVIIGAGPAGIGCAISAIKRRLNLLLIDKGNIVNSIINFPTNMTFFSTSDVLELHDIPFHSEGIRPNRIEVVKYYQGLVRYFKIPFQTRLNINQIKKKNDYFMISGAKNGSYFSIGAEKIILATGFYDNPNMLKIEGEELIHVSHYYKEPFQHFDQDVVVVGGKNSAVEAALDLHRHGARVSIVHRRREIKDNVKYWVLPDIQNRIKEGSISIFLNSTVNRINPDSIEIKIKKKIKILPADAVYLLTGYQPDVSLWKNCGVEFDQVTWEPKINPHSLESTIPGLYLAGSLIAGKNANKIFIENSREHSEKILSDVQNKLKHHLSG